MARPLPFEDEVLADEEGPAPRDDEVGSTLIFLRGGGCTPKNCSDKSTETSGENETYPSVTGGLALGRNLGRTKRTGIGHLASPTDVLGLTERNRRRLRRNPLSGAWSFRTRSGGFGTGDVRVDAGEGCEYTAKTGIEATHRARGADTVP